MECENEGRLLLTTMYWYLGEFEFAHGMIKPEVADSGGDDVSGDDSGPDGGDCILELNRKQVAEGECDNAHSQ